jgi:hypothetical protein
VVTSHLLPEGKKVTAVLHEQINTLLRQHGLNLTPTPVQITFTSHIPPPPHFTLLAQTRAALGKLLFPLTRYNHVTFSNFHNYDWSELPLKFIYHLLLTSLAALYRIKDYCNQSDGV